MTHSDGESLICPSYGATRSNEFADCPQCGWERVPAASGDAGEPDFDAPILPSDPQPAAHRTRCHCCGGSRFEWGRMYGTQHVSGWRTWLGWIFKWSLFEWESSIRSRRCIDFGNVQLFARTGE